MGDGHKTKAVQSMLRDYCTTHIRKINSNPWKILTKTFDPGFITGRTTQVIPWGALIKDPSSWISEESVPEGFEWKDPSKIQIGEVFRLFYHWRDRKEKALVPLIWVPTCPLLQVTDDEPIIRPQHIRASEANRRQASDEEEFNLSSSTDSELADEADDESKNHNSALEDEEDPEDEMDDESDDHHSNPSSSRSEQPLNMDLKASLVHETRPSQGPSGKNYRHLLI